MAKIRVLPKRKSQPSVQALQAEVDRLRAAKVFAADERWRQHIRGLWAVYEKYAPEPEPRGYDA